MAGRLSVVKDLTTDVSKLIKQSVTWHSRFLRLNTVIFKVFPYLPFSFIVSSRPQRVRRHFKIPWALLAANIWSCPRKTSFASGTTMHWLLAEICPVDSQNNRRPCRKSKKLNNCIERLCAVFGESKQDKCYRLAVELSAIKQQHLESVENELSFQTPLTASNANQSVDKWKVCFLDRFETSRSAPSRHQQIARYNCGQKK